MGTRYYRTINGHLTNEFYDIHDNGVVKTSSVVFSNADILNISKQKMITSTFTPPASLSVNGTAFNKLIKSEELNVYMKLNGDITPIKIIYSNYQSDEGYEYQDVVCINMLDNSYIDYAKLCDMSEVCFRRYFKEFTGKSPIEYRNDTRLNNAKILLQSGQYTVSEVAEACGFSNLSFFTRLYKRKYGHTPKRA